MAAMTIPPGAVELGVVQATGVGAVDEIMPEFLAEVARLGGNYGKIDGVATSFDNQMRTRNESYNCGTPQAYRMCNRTITSTEEVAITRILGRAYRVESATP